MGTKRNRADRRGNLVTPSVLPRVERLEVTDLAGSGSTPTTSGGADPTHVEALTP